MKTIFLESAFWDKFSECYRVSYRDTFDSNMRRRAKTLLDMFDCICKSEVFIDTSLSKLQQKAMTSDDPFLKHLLKQTIDGHNEKIKYQEDIFTDINTSMKLHPSAILISEKEKLELTSFYGIINIAISNFEAKDYLFNDSGIALRRGEEWEWGRLNAVISESNNSMIIVDNYIFKRERENLYRILDTVLPQKLSIPYHLTIFYIEGDERNRNNLHNYLRKIRPQLEIMLELIKTDKDPNNGYQTDFHDRAIITNHIWISSGAGFNLLKRVPDSPLHLVTDKSTTIDIYFPFIISGNKNRKADKAYCDLLSDAKESLHRRKKTSKNRLL